MMKANAISKPSMVELLLNNAPDTVQKDSHEMAFDWENAIVSHTHDELKTKLTPNKQPITIRLDSDILTAFKATGKGWQTRINEALRQTLITQGKIGNA